jgi:hypothetical protein
MFSTTTRPAGQSVFGGGGSSLFGQSTNVCYLRFAANWSGVSDRKYLATTTATAAAAAAAAATTAATTTTTSSRPVASDFQPAADRVIMAAANPLWLYV